MGRLGIEALGELAFNGHVAAHEAVEAISNAMVTYAAEPGLQRAACETLCALSTVDARGTSTAAVSCNTAAIIISTLRGHVVFPWVCSSAMDALARIVDAGDQHCQRVAEESGC